VTTLTTTTTATILVADDDRGIRTVLSQALGRAGYEVRTTGNASTLWRWVSEGEGDLVITDVVMPDESGLDLLPRIKKIRPELRIIVMSAQNTLLTAVKATQRGAFEYLPKPFDLKELVGVVGRALSAPRATPAEAAGGEDEEKLPLIGRSPAMQEIYRTLARLMSTDLCPGAARLRQAPQRPLRGHQHGRHPARADRERTVRP
jgi:two-component system nitrogen regulation response regulator GlnG